MIYYKDFISEYYIPKNHGRKDNTIFTFDIESTSYLILDGKQYNAEEYLNFTDKEQERCEFRSCMYEWTFSIEDKVFYGRTWLEFLEFLNTINFINPKAKKYIFVHNLSFEFQFLKSILYFTDVMARKSHKVMKASFLNFEFRCTYFMSNCALKQLPKVFNLPVEKQVGDLDYSLIRTPKTPLTEKELGYCEDDCLVVYYYIKMELDEYKYIWKIPLTSTGHVRKELKDRTNRNFIYRKKVRKSVNVDPHVYNLLQDAFAGGYTHSNYIYTDMILKNITSWDFTSSYPYCLLCFRYPATKFKKCNIKDINKLDKEFAYLIHIEFYDLKSNYFNHFLSQSKCYKIKNGRYDNGRIISCDYAEITITDVDLKIITSSYSYSGYKIIECYYSKYDYLPKEFLEFILEKYKNKTKYKNVKGMEVEYSKEKNKFNSLYGMSVTNTIRDDVIFDPELMEWQEVPLTNEEIQDKLFDEEKKGFLSFSYGCWCTAYRSL